MRKKLVKMELIDSRNVEPAKTAKKPSTQLWPLEFLNFYSNPLNVLRYPQIQNGQLYKIHYSPLVYLLIKEKHTPWQV